MPKRSFQGRKREFSGEMSIFPMREVNIPRVGSQHPSFGKRKTDGYPAKAPHIYALNRALSHISGNRCTCKTGDLRTKCSDERCFEINLSNWFQNMSIPAIYLLSRYGTSFFRFEDEFIFRAAAPLLVSFYRPF